jgi:hypothetical protein
MHSCAGMGEIAKGLGIADHQDRVCGSQTLPNWQAYLAPGLRYLIVCS